MWSQPGDISPTPLTPKGRGLARRAHGPQAGSRAQVWGTEEPLVILRHWGTAQAHPLPWPGTSWPPCGSSESPGNLSARPLLSAQFCSRIGEPLILHLEVPATLYHVTLFYLPHSMSYNHLISLLTICPSCCPECRKLCAHLHRGRACAGPRYVPAEWVSHSGLLSRLPASHLNAITISSPRCCQLAF